MVALDRLPTPSEIVRHLDAHVAGQERAKRDLASAVYGHYLGLAARDAHGADFGPQHLLMLGPTGCGKTLLVRTLAAHLGVPVAFCAATALVEAGYVGEQVESTLVSLLAAAGNDRRRAERGIVFLDEFDKVRRSGGTERDVSGEGVQNALLSLFDGTRSRFRVRDQEVELDTSRLLFVCAGAFAGLPEVVRRRVAHPHRMGFGGGPRGARALADEDALELAEPEDLVAFGVIPELVGRFARVTALRPLGCDELVRILGGVHGSVLARWERQFALHGVRLEVTDEARRAVAGRAIALGTGARALARLVNEALRPVAWRLPDLPGEGVCAVRLGPGAALGADAPELLRDAAAAPLPGPFPSADELRLAALAPADPRGSGKAANEPESVLQVNPAQVAGRIERLKMQLQLQSLRGERLLAWVEFERGREPRWVLWTLEQLLRRMVPVAAFADAVRAVGANPVPATVHYAAYLHERERHAARTRPPAPPGRGRDDDAPRLDL